MDLRTAEPLGELRLLVAIASFGSRNLSVLQKVLETYQDMSLQVDLIVLSNVQKDVGSAVEVIVGLPSKNPWSLPFAHKPIFAERVNDYDLFAYSEDDIEVTEKNIRAFLAISAQLRSDEVAGYLRYEKDCDGELWFPDVHGEFHWRPESAVSRGSETIAEFTNEHSAFYLLNRHQLKRAIASKGFLVGPHAGRYDMLCSAATDPYTRCGFRKVICISQIDSFLIHHLPNRYVRQVGAPDRAIRRQVQTLLKISQGNHPVSVLGPVEPKTSENRWAKDFYERPENSAMHFVPSHVRTLLSIGCGSGAPEADLVRQGIKVTALPLDSVVGSMAAERDIEVIYSSLDEGLDIIRDRKFDCVVLSHFLHLMPDPETLLKRCAELLRARGTMLLSGPNFAYLPILMGRYLRSSRYEDLDSFDKSGVNVFTINQLKTWLRRANLRPDLIAWQNGKTNGTISGSIPRSTWYRATLTEAWNWLKRLATAQPIRAERPYAMALAQDVVARFTAENWILMAGQSHTVPHDPTGSLTTASVRSAIEDAVEDSILR
jgi:2-polyprenyl-3-methyl-5-hydroxy-6-metoxy-1,4-benzoquinol methylase